MSNTLDVVRLAAEIKELDTSDRMRLLQEIIKDERISVTELLVAKVANLEDFKRKAKRDIPKIAEAGLELGEKEMRKVTGIGGYTRKKTDSFKLAMVKCLIDAGGYKGTKYGDEIAAADYSSIDEDWYDWSWKPSTIEEQHSIAKQRRKKLL